MGAEIQTLITEPTKVVLNGRACTVYPYGNQALMLPEIAELKEMSLSTLYCWVKKHGWKIALAMEPVESNQPSDRPNARMKNPELECFDEDGYLKNLIASLKAQGFRGYQLQQEAVKRVRF